MFVGLVPSLVPIRFAHSDPRDTRLHFPFSGRLYSEREAQFLSPTGTEQVLLPKVLGTALEVLLPEVLDTTGR